MQAVTAARPQGIRPAAAGAARRPAALGRPGLLASRRPRSTAARAGGEPDEALHSIDQGPGKASPSFQDMRNAQESYSEVPRHSLDLEGRDGAQKDAPESAPESGTLREASYPLESKEEVSSSEEEGASQYAAPESGDVRGGGPSG